MSILSRSGMRLLVLGSLFIASAPIIHGLTQQADATHRDRGLAFVSETFDDEQKPTGEFDAHWESEDGDQWQQGPQGVPVVEAIRWARGLTGIVLVTVGEGDVYSAGAEQAPAVRRVWPEDGLALRPRALSGHWRSVVEIPSRKDDDEKLAAHVRRVLEQSGVARSVRESSPGERRAEVRCIVEADSAPEALRAIYDVISREIRDGGSLNIEVLGPAD